MMDLERLKYLKGRLAIHKRRMRYWANLPGSFGPTGKQLRKCHEYYTLACDDADNISIEIERLTGDFCPVIDIRRTFQCSFGNSEKVVKLLREEKHQ